MSAMWELTWMYPLEFHGYMVVENLKEFIDVIYKVTQIIGITVIESKHLVSYYLIGDY